jgi:AcrR family transcriptional regulator
MPSESSEFRRERVLEAALDTFARYGYRKASMDDIARDAAISRPGLYFLFASKEKLFQAAAVHALDRDVAAAERALADRDRPLRDRLIEAFDAWTGRYIGPMAKDLNVLLDTHPHLLGPVVAGYPPRFAALVVDATGAEDVARTLISLAAGVKHDAATREEFVARMTAGIELCLLGLDCRANHR